jgi:hypothetical protein
VFIAKHCIIRKSLPPFSHAVLQGRYWRISTTDIIKEMAHPGGGSLTDNILHFILRRCPTFTRTTLKTLGAFEPCNGGLLIANLKCYLGIVLKPPQRQHAILHPPMSQSNSWFICGHARGVSWWLASGIVSILQQHEGGMCHENGIVEIHIKWCELLPIHYIHPPPRSTIQLDPQTKPSRMVDQVIDWDSCFYIKSVGPNKDHLWEIGWGDIPFMDYNNKPGYGVTKDLTKWQLAGSDNMVKTGSSQINIKIWVHI